ncbi:DUF4153 domain-containing protein [Lederbergia wuyishanensis]|uniref:DUF4173 domain-containing protein n=1 Tax=Lederbergia wuyishanensis TaxID=1347903 RepID=A0ABU0D479_9BACI|nr:DUF4173 domain-containing protein [Lederbergia wuyishanensis]MCJ8008199.1 DUF4173 domain-containing protein [Lederbergia wuyishanensis]MDQ0343212.1 hypothetical protein [Lederbergia wuyishanensis]
MELKIEKIDWLFFIMCFLVGIVAEEAFFRGQIGISYIVFIVLFYTIFCYRFRSYPFSHQRLGYLVLIAIWLLAISYYLYDTELFYALNVLIIPALVIFHLVLITSQEKTEWSNVRFIFYMLRRLIDGIRYNAIFIKYVSSLLKKSSNKKHYDVWGKILIGLIISVPLLFIILNLLISADTQFEQLITSIPNLFNFKAEYAFRFIIILIYTFMFFGFMQVLLQKNTITEQKEFKPISMDGIITLTILSLLDIVYILFVVIQFKYFFSGTLDEGYTYAEYARRGFFELLFVTLINLSVTTGVISLTKNVQGFLKSAIRSALTILVLSSGVLLISAFMRLTMYENAYGFTFTRVLAHSFMIFLMVILTYTLIKIWLEKLSLFHFYFIATLVYYVGLNIVNIDRFVVEQNFERFEQTGKIDSLYMSRFSSTGLLGLIELHEKEPNNQELNDLLKQIKAEIRPTNMWQSHNYSRTKAYEKLVELDIK